MAVIITMALLADEALNSHNFPPVLPKLEVPKESFSIIQERSKIEAAGLSDEAIEQRIQESIKPIAELDRLLRDFRGHLIEKYGMFSYVSQPFIQDLSVFIKDTPTLEVMAGNGYLTGGLRLLNTKLPIIATDNFASNDEGWLADPVTEVVEMDALDSVKNYMDQVQIILLSWAPNNSDIDYQILSYLRENDWFEGKNSGKLIVIGEKDGATNSEQFWQNAKLELPIKLNYNHQSFDLVDERVYLVK